MRKTISLVIAMLCVLAVTSSSPPAVFAQDEEDEVCAAAEQTKILACNAARDAVDRLEAGQIDWEEYVRLGKRCDTFADAWREECGDEEQE